MLDIFLRVARASKEWEFTWHQFGRYASGLLHEASPRAVVLVLPFISWDWLTYQEDWIKRWAWAVSGAPDTERVAQSVVDTLLQIVSKEELLPHIPVSIWSWLTKQPHLPAICLGRNVGTSAHVVKAVRALRDIEILKSYLLLVWSEWSHFSPDGSNGLGCPPPLVSPLTRPLVYVYPVHVAHGVLSHDASTGSDSIPDRPPSHILGSPSSRHSSSSSNRNPSGCTPDSPDSVSVHPLPPDNTLSHHLTHADESVLSRYMSISSDGAPSSPPLHISINTPICYSPPIPIGTPIPQPPVLDLPPIPVSVPIPRSSISSNNTLNHRMPNGSDNVLDHHPLPPDSTPSHRPAYTANNMPSCPTSISSNNTQGPPLRPIGPRIFRPTMMPPSYVPPQIDIQDSKWIDQTLMPSPPIDLLPAQIYCAPQSSPATPSNHMLNIRDSMSDICPPHIPNNMPSSYLSGSFYDMEISIQEDFGGIGMGHHRADLLQRLDHVLRQLDRGLEYLKQHNPAFNEDYLQRMKDRYQYLREILLKTDAQYEQSHVAFNDHAPPENHTIAIRDVPPPVLGGIIPEDPESPPPTSLVP
jgi:hypothetical protein